MLRGLAKVPLLLLCFFPLSQALSQQVEVAGGFVQDSLGIGEEIQFWLKASYPPELELLLPDSNYNFAPFELVRREFVPTDLRAGRAIDSAYYTLQSFEIEAVQYLELTALAISGTDSMVITSNQDSIYFKELVPVVTDSTVLKTNLSHVDVNRQFNFPMMWIVIVALFVVAVSVFLAFGSRIQRALMLRRLRRDYENFSSTIGKYIHQLKQDPRPEQAERALTHWKVYLERLERRPYSKYTTKEILAFEDNQELQGTLKVIDRTVYGKVTQAELFKKFQDIEDFTQHRYTMVVDKVKDGQMDTRPPKSDTDSSKARKRLFVRADKEDKVISETAITQFGMTQEELAKEVLNGGRFVIFYYTISILVMTFRRTSKVKFLKHNENAFKKGWLYTAITFLFGWWGFPWGLIYTPQSLYINLKGGKDITEEVLKSGRR
ncbi:MAG: hypothetical protein AAGA85_23260 [Bacteroidota bacterium]